MNDRVNIYVVESSPSKDPSNISSNNGDPYYWGHGKDPSNISNNGDPYYWEYVTTR